MEYENYEKDKNSAFIVIHLVIDEGHSPFSFVHFIHKSRITTHGLHGLWGF